MDWSNISGINLLMGDCMDEMALMPDKCFELACVDPPYGDNNFQGGGSHTRSVVRFGNLYRENGKDWNIPPDQNYFDTLFRISVNQIIWGGNYFSLPPTRCFIVWDKIRFVTNFSQIEMAWTSFDSQPLLYRQCGNGGFVLRDEDKDRISPTQKPVALYEWLLTNYAKPGDKILDTHAGSFSSAIACHNLEFDYVGIEKDADYFVAGKKRVLMHQRQRRLF